jgi:hypothetical protein
MHGVQPRQCGRNSPQNAAADVKLMDLDGRLRTSLDGSGPDTKRHLTT